MLGYLIPVFFGLLAFITSSCDCGKHYAFIGLSIISFCGVFAYYFNDYKYKINVFLDKRYHKKIKENEHNNKILEEEKQRRQQEIDELKLLSDALEKKFLDILKQKIIKLSY